MAFVAQYSVTVAPLDQQVEAWLLSPLLILLFLVILIKALLELPFFLCRLAVGGCCAHASEAISDFPSHNMPESNC